MPDDPLNRANFGLLPEPKGRWRSFGVSMVTNVVIIVLLLTVALTKHVVQKVQYHETLIDLTQPPPPKPKVVPPPVKVVAPPQQVLAKMEPPKIVIPKPLPEPPKPVKLNNIPEPKLPPPPPKKVEPPPQPKVGLFSSPKPTEVANNRAAPTVSTGGFGDPLGAKTNKLSTQSQVVAVGSFNNAPGEQAQGAGAARKGAVTGTTFGSGVAHGVPGGHDMGKVASAGFSNGVVGGTGKPGPHGQVETAGFSTNVGKAPTQVAVKQNTPAFVPPVVLSEPQPKYTPEAIKMRIQGEVTLKVRFLASGQVEVLQVVNGLGHGLDEQARHVAEHIRFKPAERDGHPVDHTTLIHVTFQLA